MIPEGTTNIAPHKEVTSSTPPTKGSLKMVTDGKKESETLDGEYMVEMKEGRQWVQIDLRETAIIYAVMFWLGDGPGMPRSY